MYADDLVLFSPSAKGIQRLLNVCKDFGDINNVTYNPTKSKMMYIGPIGKTALDELPTIYIGTRSLSFVDQYKYLGHIICNNLRDDEDIKSKIRSLYGRSNYLSKKFYFCSYAVKRRLFCSFVSNIYMHALWVKYHMNTISKIRVAYNNSFRIIMGLNMHCSASGMFTHFNVKSFNAQGRKCIHSILNRCLNSENVILLNFKDSHNYHTSWLTLHWVHELYTVHMIGA